MHYAKDRGALCIGLTNTVGSAIACHTDCGVHINAGCEIGVASTKAYTSQIVVITMMALALSEDSIAKRPKRDAVIDALGTLPAKLRRVSSRVLIFCKLIWSFKQCYKFQHPAQMLCTIGGCVVVVREGNS